MVLKGRARRSARKDAQRLVRSGRGPTEVVGVALLGKNRPEFDCPWWGSGSSLTVHPGR